MPSSAADNRLRWLYLDMNSFFASVEQQQHPAWRGKPVAVVPAAGDSTSVIAASYEAKAYKVKTGTNVGQAKKMCPGLILVPAQHREYVQVHQAILEAVETVLPVEMVCSIDELACRLSGSQQALDKAVQLAGRVKEAILSRVGECLQCSVGLAPNRYLAKVASDMQKPDGLTAIRPADLPQILYRLALRDLPGIGPKSEQRLQRQGIKSVETLCRLSAEEMHRVFGSIWGEQLYYLLRGIELEDKESEQQTISRSHVLPPDQRDESHAQSVLKKLLARAAAALRREGFYASAFSLRLVYRGRKPWGVRLRLPETQDAVVLFQVLEKLWEMHPGGKIYQVGLALTGLVAAKDHIPSLFDDPRQPRLSHLLDQVNRRFGKELLRFGATFEGESLGASPIAFNRIPDEEEQELD